MGTRIKVVVGVAVVVVLVIVLVSLLGGGDDDNKPKSAGTTKTSTMSSPDRAGKPSPDTGSGPALHTVIVKRASGKNATAQAGSLVQNPDQIWIRVSAAPKQPVRVTWTLACGGGSSSQDNYVVTPPHLRQLKVPGKAKTCAGSVAAQLATTGGTGRLKVALLTNR